MAFVLNPSQQQQLSLFDSYENLTEREKKFLEKSWAKYFSDYIFPKIDEKPYEVLYSKKDSRPNTPVNVQIGALLIKELTNLSDDELLSSLMFDIRFQYALHTTSFIEQPLSDRTLGRFRARCNAYEEETGIDLLHDTICSLSDEMAQIMKIDLSLKRMDSLMVASNIKKMGRLELLYTCIANLAKEVGKARTLPETLLHYIEADDRNKVIYHNHSDETSTKIASVLKDAAVLKEFCGTDSADSNNYQLLLRALREQAVQEEDGTYRLRTKEDGGIVTDYQYEQNNHSDSEFMKETLESMEKQEETVTIVTDGAYSGQANQAAAAEKNVVLVTTNLTGRKVEDFLADFVFSEDGSQVLKCPGGFAPKSCSYHKVTGQCTVSFHKCQCAKCPYKNKCHPKELKKVCRRTVSSNAGKRAAEQRRRATEEVSSQSRFRNGVETIPSILRRKYGIDHMPVRGLIKTKFYFGCKIGALNFRKFCKFIQGKNQCAQKTVNA